MVDIKTVIAESYERIHRSNLVVMGILPLQFMPGEDHTKLGLGGTEEFTFRGIAGGLTPSQQLTVGARKPDVTGTTYQALVRIDTAVKAEFYRQDGILPMVLRRLAQA